MTTLPFPTIKVGYRTYRILPWEEGDAAENNRLGEISYRAGEIRINDGRAPQERAETILHEILHALLYDSGMNLDREEEEKVVSVLAPRLTALFHDNPNEIRALVETLGRGDESRA